MKFLFDLSIVFIISLVSTFLLVYPVRKFAQKFNVMDIPNKRKVHTIPIPRTGGIAIFLGTLLGILFIMPTHEHIVAIGIGVLIIITTGLLDDKYNIRPIIKLSGQVIAAGILIYSGLIIDQVTLPIIGVIDLGLFSVTLTLLWIVGITNAINLIDGLDGLASGVSTIALTSILIMAIIDTQIIVIYLCVALIASNLGFLYHNFYPAKIYMGDTGSMFLGYMISVVSILGLFKNITLFSFIIPVIVLAVPIFDTLFAIIRRRLNGNDIMSPDKKHLHHQLLAIGLSHKAAVLWIYAVSAIFGALAVIFSEASVNLTLLIILLTTALVYIIAEIVGVVNLESKPIIRFFKAIMNRK